MRRVIGSLSIAILFAVATPAGAGSVAAGTARTPVAAARTVGYALAGADGGVFTFSPAAFSGSLGGRRVPGVIVAALGGLVNSEDVGPGYLLVSDLGRVYPFGLRSLGDLRGVHLNAPVTGAAAVPGGYVLVGADGGVFTFGRARFFGSLGGRPLAAPIVGVAETDSADGYWLVDAAGGVYPFGNAPRLASLRNAHLTSPVVGIADDPSPTLAGLIDGYVVATADGRVLALGGAKYRGSLGGVPLSQPVRGIVAAFGGYYLFAGDGGVFSFGVPFRGSMGGRPLNAPISAMVPQYALARCVVPFC